MKPSDSDADTSGLSREAARSALDELFLLAKQYSKSDKFRRLIEFVGAFKRYSMYNALLVHIQMPGARYVLRAKQWIDDYHRAPVANAQPLVMLQPKGPVMFGFDVSQTAGAPLPDGFENAFRAVGILEPAVFEHTIRSAAKDGIDVQCRPLGSVLGGYVRNANAPTHVIGLGLVAAMPRVVRAGDRHVPVFAEVTLNSNLPAETNYATLTHELGHLYCGHVGSPDIKLWPCRQGLDRNTREFEAESVSYLVCRRAGIHTPAAEYLHGYLSSTEDVPPISLDFVLRAAQRIENMGARVLPHRRADQSRE